MNLTPHLALRVLDAVAARLLVRSIDLKNQSRAEPLVSHRASAMYVLRQLGMTYHEVGHVFGRDHTTVLAACRRIGKRLCLGLEPGQLHSDAATAVVGYREEMEGLLNAARGVVAAAQKRESMGQRERLDDERNGYTHHFTIIAVKPKKFGDDSAVPIETYEVDGYLQANHYKDGRLGEIFVTVGKYGDAHAAFDVWAQATSVALQHGASIENLFRKFVGIRHEPSGPTTNKDIPRCSSVYDYVARWCLRRFSKIEVPVVQMAETTPA